MPSRGVPPVALVAFWRFARKSACVFRTIRSKLATRLPDWSSFIDSLKMDKEKGKLSLQNKNFVGLRKEQTYQVFSYPLTQLYSRLSADWDI